MSYRGFYPAIAVLVLAATTAFPAQAQNRPAPTPNDTLVSPRIADDGSVTFQLYAPQAEEVTVAGDWRWVPQPLEKDASGVWSVTVGPLKPDVYIYAFSMDGVRVVDPKNPLIKEGNRGVESMFIMEGPEADFLAERDVPHGAVQKVWYHSASLDANRRMHVYTPPGYEQGDRRYPVLYLLHGGGDNDAGWSTVGRANFILDNLLADGAIEPMVIVMPAGHAPTPGLFMGAGPDQDPFSRDLLEDIIPYVERHYRVSAEQADRAIAGLSMGGVQALNIGLFNPDTFAHLVAMSTGYFPPVIEQMEEQFGDVLNNPSINDQLALFWIGIGRDDFAFDNNQNTMALLDRHGVEYVYHETEGGHNWTNWRQYLATVAPLLFR